MMPEDDVPERHTPSTPLSWLIDQLRATGQSALVEEYTRKQREYQAFFRRRNVQRDIRSLEETIAEQGDTPYGQSLQKRLEKARAKLKES